MHDLGQLPEVAAEGGEVAEEEEGVVLSEGETGTSTGVI